ncbi:hypothetical protein ACFSGI_08870 [Paenibacillus nicotianae]|uniref:Transposase n=1 Tax=Paenibacillus nicotianae TaxID=1526551 RepID=A0ABW4UVA7_9BACL
MKYTVTQVGRRWFKVKAEVSTFRKGIESIAVVVDVEATLKEYDGHHRWVLSGLGKSKYHNGIKEALNNRIEFLKRTDAERLPF